MVWITNRNSRTERIKPRLVFIVGMSLKALTNILHYLVPNHVFVLPPASLILLYSFSKGLLAVS